MYDKFKYSEEKNLMLGMCAYAIELATTNYDFKQITTDFNKANVVEK